MFSTNPTAGGNYETFFYFFPWVTFEYYFINVKLAGGLQEAKETNNNLITKENIEALKRGELPIYKKNLHTPKIKNKLKKQKVASN